MAIFAHIEGVRVPYNSGIRIRLLLNCFLYQQVMEVRAIHSLLDMAMKICKKVSAMNSDAYHRCMFMKSIIFSNTKDDLLLLDKEFPVVKKLPYYTYFDGQSRSLMPCPLNIMHEISDTAIIIFHIVIALEMKQNYPDILDKNIIQLVKTLVALEGRLDEMQTYWPPYMYVCLKLSSIAAKAQCFKVLGLQRQAYKCVEAYLALSRERRAEVNCNYLGPPVIGSDKLILDIAVQKDEADLLAEQLEAMKINEENMPAIRKLREEYFPILLHKQSQLPPNLSTTNSPGSVSSPLILSSSNPMVPLQSTPPSYSPYSTPFFHNQPPQHGGAPAEILYTHASDYPYDTIPQEGLYHPLPHSRTSSSVPSEPYQEVYGHIDTATRSVLQQQQQQQQTPFLSQQHSEDSSPFAASHFSQTTHEDAPTSRVLPLDTDLISANTLHSLPPPPQQQHCRPFCVQNEQSADRENEEFFLNELNEKETKLERLEARMHTAHAKHRRLDSRIESLERLIATYQSSCAAANFSEKAVDRRKEQHCVQPKSDERERAKEKEEERKQEREEERNKERENEEEREEEEEEVLTQQEYGGGLHHHQQRGTLPNSSQLRSLESFLFGAVPAAALVCGGGGSTIDEFESNFLEHEEEFFQDLLS